MKVEAKIPVCLHFDDYHELDALRDHLRAISPGMKVKELRENVCGFPHYVGMVYVGRLTDPVNAACLKKQKEMMKQ